jgi:hypothetical protein
MPFCFPSKSRKESEPVKVTYNYEPLDPKKREIRLLTVTSWNEAAGRPGRRGTAITGLLVILRTVSLDEKPKF